MKTKISIKVQGWVKVLPFCLFVLLPLHAQTRQWTLRQCIDHAISHNISIKQKENVCKQRGYQLSTAKNSRMPDLNAQASESFSFGRGLTLDNTYTNRSTNSTSLSLGTTVPLFTGFQIPNQIKLSELNLEAATQDLEKARNDIRMKVAQAYVQILYDMEMADVAHRQVAIDSQQVARLEAFVENGKASVAELSRQRSTLATSRLTATQANNSYQLSLLALTQLLELPSPEDFAVVKVNVNDNGNGNGNGNDNGNGNGNDNGNGNGNGNVFLRSSLPSPEIIYAEALTFKPEVQAEQFRVSAAERSINIAKAARYPTLNFSAGLQTNYYKTVGIMADNFTTQLKNNFAQYVGLSLNVPIFSRFKTRNNIRSACVDLENQHLQLENVKKTLYKEIQQVYYNAVAADSKFHSSKAAARSGYDAFLLTEAKYENGKATITEFNEAKTNYLKAESDHVKARYEYLYQTALMDFYRGRELDF